MGAVPMTVARLAASKTLPSVAASPPPHAKLPTELAQVTHGRTLLLEEPQRRLHAARQRPHVQQEASHAQPATKTQRLAIAAIRRPRHVPIKIKTMVAVLKTPQHVA